MATLRFSPPGVNASLWDSYPLDLLSLEMNFGSWLFFSQPDQNKKFLLFLSSPLQSAGGREKNQIRFGKLCRAFQLNPDRFGSVLMFLQCKQ